MNENDILYYCHACKTYEETHINWACLNCGKSPFIESVPKYPNRTIDELPQMPRILNAEEMIAELAKVIDRLQNITFREYFLEDEKLNFPKDCAICLNPFINDESLVQLKNCDHIFHKSCVLNAVKYCNACPLCKRPAITSS
ncbi:Oidioi.mRNA.OKI2018_I69.chr1.g385.t1.cds [Oikopleura dioica]|uniref:Oidioi.mRNA.OKI2018_I69.chr1.g385.t1.cds n=1 Tax=Oikopleura dioica TaxID=34765 RepID=A0ABN7SJN6_OIKDI|nr:Oidioi.mRNA.OKI2018_I69.chr1.g385.t1.cds [Oikopleura dioica]